MAKTRKIMDIKYNGHYVVIVDFEAEVNPFRLYMVSWDTCKSGYGLSEHKKLIAKYADFESCVHYLLQLGLLKIQ